MPDADTKQSTMRNTAKILGSVVKSTSSSTAKSVEVLGIMYGVGDVIETPDTNPEKFEDKKINGVKVKVNKKDKSVWSKDRGTNSGGGENGSNHNGSDWKRYPNAKIAEKSNSESLKFRQTITKEGKVLRK